MAIPMHLVLAELVRGIAHHRQRTGELATWRGFWAWQPVWVPPAMPPIIDDRRPFAERV